MTTKYYRSPFSIYKFLFQPQSKKRKILIFNSLERRKKQNLNDIKDKQNTILANP